jgi:hypothetical protein
LQSKPKKFSSLEAWQLQCLKFAVVFVSLKALSFRYEMKYFQSEVYIKVSGAIGK